MHQASESFIRKRVHERDSSGGHDGGPARPSKRANRALGKQDAHPAAQAPRVHECTTCGKAFPCPSKDTEHVRVHTGERPFSCHACGDAFATSGTLARHLRTHMGDKPVQQSREARPRAYERRSMMVSGAKSFLTPFLRSKRQLRSMLDHGATLSVDLASLLYEKRCARCSGPQGPAMMATHPIAQSSARTPYHSFLRLWRAGAVALSRCTLGGPARDGSAPRWRAAGPTIPGCLAARQPVLHREVPARLLRRYDVSLFHQYKAYANMMTGLCTLRIRARRGWLRPCAQPSFLPTVPVVLAPCTAGTGLIFLLDGRLERVSCSLSQRALPRLQARAEVPGLQPLVAEALPAGNTLNLLLKIGAGDRSPDVPLLAAAIVNFFGGALPTSRPARRCPPRQPSGASTPSPLSLPTRSHHTDATRGAVATPVLPAWPHGGARRARGRRLHRVQVP